MAPTPATSRAARSICFIGILISVLSFPLLAQTSGELEVRPFNLSVCGRSSDGGRVSSVVLGQDGSNPNDASGSNSRAQDDWVNSWMRKVDDARASQPHFVAPIVTTHVMLVQQYRYDMSWQQDPTGGTVTSNYGASLGLEIIPTTRLEVGILPPGYLVHQSM